MSTIRKLNLTPKTIYVRYGDLNVDEPYEIIGVQVEYNEKFDFNRIKLRIKLTNTLFGYLYLPSHYLDILDADINQISELVSMFIIYKGMDTFGCNKIHHFEFQAAAK